MNLARAARARTDRARGFTLIELLMVVAIIGLLAATAVPVYARILNRAQRNAFAADAGQIYAALKQYYIDNSTFPPEAGPPGTAFSVTTLEPLVGSGYMSAAAARACLSRMEDSQITVYIAPDDTGPDSDILIAMRPRYSPSEYVYIFHTDLLSGTYGDLGGVYWYRNGELVAVDQVTD